MTRRPLRNGLDLRAGVVVGVAVAGLALAGFALAEALEVDLLLRPGDRMGSRPAAGAAAVGVGLLVADIVLPVPSSAVMVAHGALFGVIPGAVLSLLGRTGSAVVGVLLGRGAARVAAGRTAAASPRAEALVGRWGLTAVAVTRPVPVLAEATVVAAGAMGLGATKVVAAAAVGAVPEAVLYAMAGAAAASSTGAAAVFLVLLALALVAWAASGAFERRGSRA